MTTMNGHYITDVIVIIVLGLDIMTLTLVSLILPL